MDELGGDEQAVGLLLGSYAAMQLIFAPVWGRISDRIGRRPALSRLLTTFFIYTIAFSIIHVTFVEYGRDVLRISPHERGFVFMFMGIVGVITQAAVVRRLARRLGEDRVIELGLLSMALGLAAVPFLRTVTLVYIGCLFIALGNGLVTPSVMAAVSPCAQGSTSRGWPWA